VIGVKRSSNVCNPILNDLATARQAKDLVGFIAPWRFESSLRHQKLPYMKGVSLMNDELTVSVAWAEIRLRTQPRTQNSTNRRSAGRSWHYPHT